MSVFKMVSINRFDYDNFERKTGRFLSRNLPVLNLVARILICFLCLVRHLHAIYLPLWNWTEIKIWCNRSGNRYWCMVAVSCTTNTESSG